MGAKALEPGDDKPLMARVADGDQQAFGRIFDHYSSKVYAYAFRFLRSQQLSEDIVQDVFTNIWLKRDKLPEINSFGAYLRVVSKNLTLNALKKLALDFKTNEISQKEWNDIDNATESGIMVKETLALLNEAIQKLPPQQQHIYRMCHMEGLKQKEVAERLHISPLTVKVHLREATKTIRGLMDNHADLPLLMVILFHLAK